MRLANGIVIDKEATFGALKFSALRREVHLQNEDSSVSEEIKERTYDLKSRGQGRMLCFITIRQQAQPTLPEKTLLISQLFIILPRQILSITTDLSHFQAAQQAKHIL